ncbi:B3 domain-containing protein Os01g0905400-like [Vigna umbellata]|uniref:B3 domain-containing protein Os01g0905400-like n=1 Tax=Vigna umbellata TaxID=87088 RepID=UPI001F5F2811|nr:B3 domain-containing protein Os01g0905400-like [Vigna umbellata]XP_047174426.1 B3 domain-containing protein Os01g0905400-like [Vigna umbellata]
MGGEEQGVSVCAACTHNCLLFHQTKQTSPTSFFKFLTRQDYLTTLCIPPAFSGIVASMVNKKINLNDSTGQQWKVKVSEVNGSFVFGEGWSRFSSGHGLKVGYLLVLNYIKDLHFDVKIYDTSACEKLGLPEKRNQKKRSRGKIGSPVRDGILVRQELDAPRQCSEVDLVVPQKAKESGQHVLVLDHSEEDPCHSKSLEFDQSHEDDGTMKSQNGDLIVSNVDYESNIVEKDAMICSKDTMLEGVLSTEVALDISELRIYGRSASLEADTYTYDKTFNSKIEENKAILSNREAQECQFSKALGEMKKLPVDMTPNLDSSMDEFHLTGEVSKKLKKEFVTLNEMEATGLPKEINGLLNSDIFNEDNASHFKPTQLSCVVPHDNVFLELPSCLPLIRKVKVDQQRKMLVFLRDPLRRLWPVYYHEKPHLKLLAHGWLDFSRANNIQPKDECIFEAEVDPECKSKRILSVQIVHNK